MQKFNLLLLHILKHKKHENMDYFLLNKEFMIEIEHFLFFS